MPLQQRLMSSLPAPAEAVSSSDDQRQQQEQQQAGPSAAAAAGALTSSTAASAAAAAARSTAGGAGAAGAVAPARAQAQQQVAHKPGGRPARPPHPKRQRPPGQRGPGRGKGVARKVDDKEVDRLVPVLLYEIDSCRDVMKLLLKHQHAGISPREYTVAFRRMGKLYTESMQQRGSQARRPLSPQALAKDNGVPNWGPDTLMGWRVGWTHSCGWAGLRA